MTSCSAPAIFCLTRLGLVSIIAARYGSCQIGYFRIMSRTVSLLGQPTRPDGQHALQRFRCKNSLTFSRPTPAESTVKRCALAYRSSGYCQLRQARKFRLADHEFPINVKVPEMPGGRLMCLEHLDRKSVV